MPLKRSELKTRLNPASNAVPGGADYAALINSVLNLRDDQFYGVWRPDGVYYNGAVVIHKKSFYALETKPDTVFCSEKAPDQDKDNWKRIEENCADEDWFMSEDKHNKHMWANKEVQFVGIGTANPQATLDVTAKGFGKIKLQPNLKDPKMEILNLDPACQENKLTLRVTTLAAELETDSPDGIHVIKDIKKAGVPNVPVLYINATEQTEPRVGIGTMHPDAHLEIQKKDVGAVKIDGGEKSDKPFIKIIKPGHSFLKLLADETEVAIVSKSYSGLMFQHKVANDDVETQVTIAANGNVGIGTKLPKSKLHIETADARDGAIKLGFCATYPVLHLINHKVPDRAGSYYNSFASGTTTEAAVLKTDSDKGFAFKKPGKDINEESQVCDLNDGLTLVRIYPNGTMTIGDLAASDFRLDVDGLAHATGLYLNADRRDMDLKYCEQLGDVLPRICALKPLRFRWKYPPVENDQGKWEIGMIADEVKPQFDEVVVDDSIAYQNLVPVLVRAIQEQQAMIEALREDVKSLKRHGGHHSKD
jgi:hypothetical protein